MLPANSSFHLFLEDPSFSIFLSKIFVKQKWIEKYFIVSGGIFPPSFRNYFAHTAPPHRRVLAPRRRGWEQLSAVVVADYVSSFVLSLSTHPCALTASQRSAATACLLHTFCCCCGKLLFSHDRKRYLRLCSFFSHLFLLSLFRSFVPWLSLSAH